MDKYLKFSLVTLVFIGTITGCGSSKEASKENFMEVLNSYHQNNDCVMASIMGADDLLQSATVKVRKPDDAKQYDALVEVGFLESEDGIIEEQALFGKDIHKIPTKTYTLTESGRKIYHFKKSLFGGSAEFCISKYQVKEINSFSEPTPMLGYTISRVFYSASADSDTDWTSNQRFQTAFPKIREQLIGIQQKKATLLLLDSGWVHEEELDKQKIGNKAESNNPLNSDPENAPRLR